jgi:hypothetical protein
MALLQRHRFHDADFREGTCGWGDPATDVLPSTDAASPNPDPTLVEPEPDVLRAYREECKLVGRPWRLKLGIQASIPRNPA